MTLGGALAAVVGWRDRRRELVALRAEVARLTDERNQWARLHTEALKKNQETMARLVVSARECARLRALVDSARQR